MSFEIVSYCVNCGAPIWIQKLSQIKDFPPPTFFSCACKPEKFQSGIAAKSPKNFEVEASWTGGDKQILQG